MPTKGKAGGECDIDGGRQRDMGQFCPLARSLKKLYGRLNDNIGKTNRKIFAQKLKYLEKNN
jgi:hypothetical protein